MCSCVHRRGRCGSGCRCPLTLSNSRPRLYGTLHQLDAEQFDWIAIETPDDTPEWEAVLDRLRRAPEPRWQFGVAPGEIN